MAKKSETKKVNKSLGSKIADIIPPFVLLTLILSIVYAIIKICLSQSGYGGEFGERMKSDYVLMLLQCIVGVIAIMLPAVIERKWQLKISGNMTLAFVIFLYCAIYLGEVRSFYYRLPNWDTVLHTFSGAMLGALGFSVVSLLNDRGTVVKLSPFFVSLFAFCFAATMGVIWEVYEFSFDGILGLNMQKFMIADGTALIGREALQDTMKDLIVDILGALAICTMGYFGINSKSSWIEKFSIKRITQKNKSN